MNFWMNEMVLMYACLEMNWMFGHLIDLKNSLMMEMKIGNEHESKMEMYGLRLVYDDWMLCVCN